jgi:hypothetical protein
MNYFTVFGRLLGDDDDSCLVTKAEDDNDAIEQFRAWLAEERKYDDLDPEEEIYISYILKSSTKPKIVSTPWGAS